MSICNWVLATLAVAASTSAVAAEDRYTIDTDHTYPSLEMPHMGVSVWRGKFNRSKGTVLLDRAARKGSVDVSIDSASIDFGHDQMNEHAVAVEWLNVQKFPTLTYRGALRFKGDTPVAVDGTLTLLGVTRPLNLTIRTFRCMAHPYYKKDVCGADAEADLDRADFGLTKYTEDGAGKIHVRIQVEAMKEDTAPPAEKTHG